MIRPTFLGVVLRGAFWAKKRKMLERDSKGPGGAKRQVRTKIAKKGERPK